MPGLSRAVGVKRLEASWTADIGDYVTALAWAPDGRTLAAAAANGPVFLLDAVSGRTVRILSGHGFGTLAVDWSRDGRWVATGGQDGKARIWEAATGAEVAGMDGGAAWVEHVAWSPASDTLATAAGKHLKLWQADGSLLAALAPHPSTITGLQWRADGTSLASSAYGGVRIWRVGCQVGRHMGSQRPDEGAARGLPSQVFPWNGPLIALRWSPDGKHLACGCQDGSVHVWNTETGDDLEMTGYPFKVRELAWDREGRYLATGGGPSAIVWDFAGKGPAGSRPKVLSAHGDRIAEMAFGPDGPLLVTGGQDGAAFFWNVTEPKRPLAVGLQEAPVSRLAWQPGGRQVAIGYASGAVALWAAP